MKKSVISAKLGVRMKNLPPYYGKIFLENSVTYCIEPKSQVMRI
jgi:hypothetical protein